MKKRLSARHAQHLTGLALPDGDGLNPTAEDFGEIGGVVDGKGEDGGVHAVEVHARQCRNGEIDGEDLQHQRRAAHHQNIQRRRHADDLAPAHAQQRHGQTERQGKQQREEENNQRVIKAARHGKHELHKRIEIVEVSHEGLRKGDMDGKRAVKPTTLIFQEESSIWARRFPKGDAPNGRRKRSESPLVGRWGKAPYSENA